MYRQFTSGGTERDVSRWLKEMGYRGQGLKKECLVPLCRGEMTEVWDALFVSCRPPEVVAAMKRKVDLKLQRQAAIESRQRSHEDVEKRQAQIDRIGRLMELSKIRDAEVSRLKGQLNELRSDLSKSDGSHVKQKGAMERKLRRTKLLAAFAARSEASAKSVEEERRHLQKHNAEMKKAIAQQGELGVADFESVMQAMYDFTSDQLCQRLQQRPAGELLKPDDVMPVIQARPQTKDPGVSRLMGGVGRLYAHYAPRLTTFLTDACKDADFAASQYEAKYMHCTKKLEGSWDVHQTRGVEEIQVSHLRSYVSLCQAEEGMHRRMAGLKGTPEVQQLLAAVEAAGCQGFFNARLDALCLQNEIETLEKEMKRLEGVEQQERVTEKDLKSLYTRMHGHVEQSRQMDLLLTHCMQQLSQLQREFNQIRMEVGERLGRDLHSAIASCLEALRGCQDILGRELEKFGKYNIEASPMELSLSAESRPSQFPLLQRWDLAFNSAPSEAAPYWISSLGEVATELKSMVPLMKTESPEALFSRISTALQFSLSNSHISKALLHQINSLSKSSQKLISDSSTLAQKHRQKEQETEASSRELDEMVANGHSVLHRLQVDVPSACSTFKDQSAFSSVPWIQRDGLNASEWVAASKHTRTLKQDALV